MAGRPGGSGPTRRSLLGGLAALGGLRAAGAGGAACRPFGQAGPRARSTGPEAPDVVTARRVLAAEESLLAAYAAAVRRHPSLAAPLRPFRRRHEAHRQALTGHLPPGYTPHASASGRTASGPPSGTPSDTPSGTRTPGSSGTPSTSATSASPPASAAAEIKALRAAERAAATDRLDAALDAGPALAELLASVGACEAAHAKLLHGVQT